VQTIMWWVSGVFSTATRGAPTLPSGANGAAAVVTLASRAVRKAGSLQARDDARADMRADFGLVVLDYAVESGRFDIAFLDQNRLERANLSRAAAIKTWPANDRVSGIVSATANLDSRYAR
jgi:hypothetical protein